MHQGFDEDALRSSLPQCHNVRGSQSLFPSESDTPLFRLLDPIHLPLSAYLRLKLGKGSQHVEEQALYGITGVDMLIENLQVDLFALQRVGDPAQMQGGACQPIEACHHERITFPDIFQTSVRSRPLARCTAGFLLENFMAVLQLIELDIEALPNRADPCIANKATLFLPHVSLFHERCETRIMRHELRHVKRSVSQRRPFESCDRRFKGLIVTMDALLTQRQIAQQIVDAEGDIGIKLEN